MSKRTENLEVIKQDQTIDLWLKKLLDQTVNWYKILQDEDLKKEYKSITDTQKLNKAGNKKWLGTYTPKWAVDNPIIHAKLQAAFSMWANVVQACLVAWISPVTYYSIIKEYPNLAELYKAVREVPNLLALNAVIKSFDSRPELAIKWLERRMSKEFAPRVAIPVELEDEEDEEELDQEDKELLTNLLKEE